MQKLSMMHVYGDPLKYRDLESKIAVEKFNSAIILCDAAWVDPDQVDQLSQALKLLSWDPQQLFALTVITSFSCVDSCLTSDRAAV